MKILVISLLAVVLSGCGKDKCTQWIETLPQEVINNNWEQLGKTRMYNRHKHTMIYPVDKIKLAKLKELNDLTLMIIPATGVIDGINEHCKF